MLLDWSVDPELERSLRAGAAAVGTPLDDRIVAGLARYLDLLLLWNRRVNLTAVRDARAIVASHFVDSLAVVAAVPAQARTLVDVGAGAGFPGAVVALARPDLEVALVESIHKKAAFLETLRRELPLANVTVHARRAEELRLAVDVAVSRATWDLGEWLERGRAFVAPGGLVIGMEGVDQHDLPAGALRRPYPLAGRSRALVLFHVEQSPADH
jgi:16S rRNA (guanine527-N7)-methyltransferase